MGVTQQTLDERRRQIAAVYPRLPISRMAVLSTEGQFSEVLLINDALIFRFPRSPFVAEEMKREVMLLRKLQDRFTLAIPNPLYERYDDGELVFMGYALIPGAPLWNDTLRSIHDETVLQRLADQLGTFLRELHRVPVEALDMAFTVGETRDDWQQMYGAFRKQLFPHIRPDARRRVAQRFEAFLNDAGNFNYQPVLRHGDFGGSNILYDPGSQSITGIIDFSFAGPGDPAQDAGALSCFGADFFARCCAPYPELRSMMGRADFYRSTYALQQALYGLRDGSREDFEDGMRDYV